jgi:multidrug efflux pump
MLLSDISVKRPVFATVLSLLLIVVGVQAFFQLPLREFPDVDPPIVSVETNYRGASAAVIESRITRLIEDAISGIEGIDTINANSENGRSNVTIEFTLEREIEGATNDVRDAVNRIVPQLPPEADPPQVAKQDADAQPILWLNLYSERLDTLALTDYAVRYLVDGLSAYPGVARVIVGGQQRYAMRIWLDRQALAARGLTVPDVINALRRENVELPAGRIESAERDFTVRIDRGYRSSEAFAALPIARRDDGHVITLSEVARVELGSVERRSVIRGNGQQQIGLGIVRQSQANTLEVARGMRAEVERLSRALPEGMELVVAFDTSVYIESSIDEVYFTLALSMGLVILVIYGFLGSWRAAIIPAVTVPICVISTFTALWAFGFSINLITLLALVLSIGLVVDDAIVVLENCQRRVDEGEPRLVGAMRGARQVGFAVIATTAVLVAVFLPIAFLEGNLGRLFRELGLAISAAVFVSSLVALSLSPMMASKLLVKGDGHTGFAAVVDGLFRRLEAWYRRTLDYWLRHGKLMVGIVVGSIALSGLLYQVIPKELSPPEDQGSFFITINGPEGAGFDYTLAQGLEVEKRLLKLVDEGVATRVIFRAPRGFGGAGSEEMHTAQALVFLAPWGERPDAFEIQQRLQRELDQIAGLRSFVIMRQGLSRGGQAPVQFVLGGPDYETLADWRDRLLARAAENPNLVGLDADYKETRPQLRIQVDRERASDLGVSVEEIGTTLETLLGSRRATTFERDGEEYDVILQADREDRAAPSDLDGIYVRSRTGELIALANLVTTREIADAGQLNRYNRLRSITLSARLAPGYPIGDALTYLNTIAAEELPRTAKIDYRGESREYMKSGSTFLLTFVLALLVVYLVLAAQFESFLHPLVIITTVPLAVLGAFSALALLAWLPALWGAPPTMGASVNLYSAIGIVILVGIATKNGILIVEFANQLRDAGRSIAEATLESSVLRLRPILMTSISTIAGAMPLVFAEGAGENSRFTIGVVIAAGIALATVLTLFVVPALYNALAGYTRSPRALEREIAREDEATPEPLALRET